jgi:IS30 family transposase
MGTRARVDSEYKETLDENEISRRKANRWQDMFMACYSEDEIAEKINATNKTIERETKRLRQSSTKNKMSQSFSPQLYDI